VIGIGTQGAHGAVQPKTAVPRATNHVYIDDIDATTSAHSRRCTDRECAARSSHGLRAYERSTSRATLALRQWLREVRSLT